MVCVSKRKQMDWNSNFLFFHYNQDNSKKFLYFQSIIVILTAQKISCMYQEKQQSKVNTYLISTGWKIKQISFDWPSILKRMLYGTSLYIWLLGWWQLGNFLVLKLKFNRFLSPNEHSQRIFWYLARQLSWEPTKLGHIFTK